MKWLEGSSQHSQHDGAAVQALDHLIARTEQDYRAWRATAERDSRDPHPERFAAFRCQDCDARFLADRVFDVARKAEVALLVAGHRAELTPADEMLAESFEAPSKWMRCPECASSNICLVQEQNDIEPLSIETVTDMAGMIMDDIRPTLPKFEESKEARIECMNRLWDLCVTLSRGCELAREGDKLDELMREFGREEGVERFERWIEEKKIRPPASNSKALCFSMPSAQSGRSASRRFTNLGQSRFVNYSSEAISRESRDDGCRHGGRHRRWAHPAGAFDIIGLCSLCAAEILHEPMSNTPIGRICPS